MLEDTVSRKHPFFLGPILIHQRKNFSAFNYLASTLIGFNKKLQDVQVFGTDGDPALIEALSHNFHSAKQLRCFIHLRRNVAEKIRDRGIPNSETQEFLADISLMSRIAITCPYCTWDVHHFKVQTKDIPDLLCESSAQCTLYHNAGTLLGLYFNPEMSLSTPMSSAL